MLAKGLGNATIGLLFSPTENTLIITGLIRFTIIKSVSYSLVKNLVYSIQNPVGCQEKSLKPNRVMRLQPKGIQ
jgi:hypothetical protein